MRDSTRQEASAKAAGAGEREEMATGKLLAALYERGRAAHPRIALDEQAFESYLAGRATEGDLEALANLAIDDLYLACACLSGTRGAAAALQRRCAPVIRRAVSRVLTKVDERQEAEQRVWQSLLGNTADGPARLAMYLGRGSLDNWVSVASMRIAISLGRSESAERRLRDKAMAEATGVPSDAAGLEGEARGAFEAAVSGALARLKPRERLALKLYLVSGMTLDAVGKSLGVTRQAVTKTLARARKKIVREVGASGKPRLTSLGSDRESVLRFAATQLEGSISRVLRSVPDRTAKGSTTV